MKLANTIKKMALGLPLLFGANVAFAKCGDVQIAEMNWASAGFMAQVDKFILEAGYGCDVELVPGDTTTSFAAMNTKGKPGATPELWTNAVREPLAQAVADGSLHLINKAPITGLGEGWWITPATAKRHPELKTVLDVLERPDLFPWAEDPSKGAFIGCPAGWGCQLANANLFRAFDMEAKGWKLVDPGSSAGLDGSMTKAVERDQNWFGYYWTPTSLIGRHQMVKLDFGVPFAGDDNWDGCIVKPEQECDNPKPSSWTHSEVQTVVTTKFKNTIGKDVTKYLSKRTYPGDVMNEMLVYMDDNQADGADAAAVFLEKHPKLWRKWVSRSAAKKVTAAL